MLFDNGQTFGGFRWYNLLNHAMGNDFKWFMLCVLFLTNAYESVIRFILKKEGT